MDVKQRVVEVLEEKIRPVLHGHGGDVRLADYTNGTVYVELQGACVGCPSADLDTKSFIEAALCSEIPEVRHVELERAVSPELLHLARKLLRGE